MNLKRFFAVLLTLVLLTSFYACGGGSSLSLECEKCGTEYKLGALYCSACGNPLVDSKPVCSKGHENEVGAMFCSACGETLNSNTNSNDGSVDNKLEQNENSTSYTPTDPNASVWLLLESVENTGYRGGVINTRQYNYTSSGTCKSAEETGTWRIDKADFYTADITYNYQSFEDGVAVSCTYKRAYLPKYEMYPENDIHWDVYDKNGNFLYRTNNSDDWFTPYESTETRDTDGGGKEITKTKTLANGVEVTDISLYDEGGALIKFTHNCPSYKNASPLKAEIVEYENGKMVRYYQHFNVVGYDDPYLRAACEYDNNGNCVKTTVYNESGTVWAITQYTYITLKDYLEQQTNLNNGNSGGNSENGSSGSGSSGSSTNGTKCVYCNQSGKMDCSACDGTGKVFSRFDDNGNKIMKTCTNPSCSNGKIKCPYCGGDGIFGN